MPLLLEDLAHISLDLAQISLETEVCGIVVAGFGGRELGVVASKRPKRLVTCLIIVIKVVPCIGRLAVDLRILMILNWVFARF